MSHHRGCGYDLLMLAGVWIAAWFGLCTLATMAMMLGEILTASMPHHHSLSRAALVPLMAGAPLPSGAVAVQVTLWLRERRRSRSAH
jgi:hypothetical protein